MISKIKQLICKIKGSKDGKTLVANFGYLSLLQFASYLFPLITMPYLAKTIGVEGLGKIAFASAIIVWFETIADWGFNYTATRDIAKNIDNKERISEIFSNVLWARVFLMFISLATLSVLIVIIPKFRENANLIFISFLLIPGHIMFPDWFFQAIERMKYITILNIISKIIFTIAIFVFIKDKQDYILQPLFVSFGFVFSGIIAMYYIIVKWRIRVYFPPFKIILETIKSSTNVFFNNLMPNLWNSLSVVLLGFTYGEIATGILEAGKKFEQICVRFFSVITRVFFPFLSRKIDNHTLYAKLSISISLIFAILLFIFSPIIIYIFFGKDFENSIIVLRLYSVSILFYAMDNVYGVNYMLVKGYDKQFRNITIISSIAATLTMYPLIKAYSYIGVTIVYNIGLGLIGILTMIFVMKDKKLKKNDYEHKKNSKLS